MGWIPLRRLWEGCNGSWGENTRENHSGTSPEVGKTARKADFGTFSDLNHLLEGVERSELVLGGLDTSSEVVGGLYWVLG